MGSQSDDPPVVSGRSMPRPPSASPSDTISPSCEVIEVRVAELRQLFNAMDPSPFRERDLDPAAEEHIANWVAEVPSSAPLCLLVHLDRRAGVADEAALLGEAIQQFFRRRGEGARRRLRDLFAAAGPVSSSDSRF